MSTATIDHTLTTPAADGTRWAEASRRLAEQIAPAAAEHDRAGTFVADGIDAARDAGVLSMLVPAELGGGGATYAETCAALTAIAHGCPSTALTLSMHTHLVAAQVWRHHRELPAPVLRRVADDQILLVSTGAADWVDSHGAAIRVDGGFRVSARKSPSSGAPAGDVVVSSAPWSDGPDGPQVIHFAVPFSAEGVNVQTTWDTMGMRGTGSETVVFDDVFVPEAAVSLVRPAGQWHPVWNTVIGAAMPLIMSVYVGVAEAAADRAIDLLRARQAGGLTDDTAVALLGRTLTQVRSAQDSLAAMVRLNDDLHFPNSDELAGEMLSRKTTVADAAIGAVRSALDAVGGVGFSTSTGLERLYRDVHGALYHPLPAARQELFSGSVALGGSPVS